MTRLTDRPLWGRPDGRGRCGVRIGGREPSTRTDPAALEALRPTVVCTTAGRPAERHARGPIRSRKKVASSAYASPAARAPSSRSATRPSPTPGTVRAADTNSVKADVPPAPPHVRHCSIARRT